MRIAVAGALAVFCVVTVVAALLPSIGFAERVAAPSGGGGGLITVAAQAGDHRQQLIVVDPETRFLAVYHVDLSNGEVTLKSVRNIHYDLRMNEFNGTSPLPREVR